MAKDSLIIIGASGHGKVVADIALTLNKWEQIFFLDDNENIESCLGIKVIGKVNSAYYYKDEADFVIAIGNNEIRKKIQEEYEAIGLALVSMVHPKATVGKNVSINSGTVIMAGVVINSGTKIGKGCIVNTGSTIDHDSVIENFTHISPGVHIAGTVHVGKRTWIGIGSTISNNVYIHENCTIGAGSLIIKDIRKSGVYIGAPARRIKDGTDFNIS